MGVDGDRENERGDKEGREGGRGIGRMREEIKREGREGGGGRGCGGREGE